MATVLGHRAKVLVASFEHKNDLTKFEVLPTTQYSLNETTDSMETTTHATSDSGYKSYALGLSDGTFTASMYLNNTDKAFKILYEAKKNKTLIFLRIFDEGLNDTNDKSQPITKNYKQGSFYITNFTGDVGTSGPVPISLECKPTTDSPIEDVEVS